MPLSELAGAAPDCGQMHRQTHRHGAGCSGDSPLLSSTGEHSWRFAKMCYFNFGLKLYYFGEPSWIPWEKRIMFPGERKINAK